MDDVIERLQSKIQSLIQQCEDLKQLNLKLRQSKVQLSREKELLLAKHKNAITQIETMVSRLKSLERTQ